MKARNAFHSTVFLLATAGLLGGGCGHAPRKDSANEVISASASFQATTLGSSDSETAQGLKTVRFAFDSHLLDDEAKARITDNSHILLKDHPELKIQIEGHADARGGIQYNVALGEKRAEAVRQLLIELGVDERRLSTISYGKERPVVSGDTEEAYARNRRANFVITAK